VPDLLWDDVSRYFDADSIGTLPDLTVPDASAGDWQSVLDLVTESGWRFAYFEGTSPRQLPPAAAVLSRPADAECPELHVWPAEDILAIFRFYAANEIDFDVDLRELQGQDRLDVFCGFLVAIGRRLGKPVLMDSEGGDGTHPILGYDVEADRVVLMG
jgi:hypothetical protein